MPWLQRTSFGQAEGGSIIKGLLQGLAEAFTVSVPTLY